MKYSLLIAVVFVFRMFSAQEVGLAAAEVELEALLSELRVATSDSEKSQKNSEFRTKLAEALTLDGALKYPFEKLKTVGIIDSPDQMFRIVNWNVEQEDLNHQYFCFVLFVDKKNEKHKVVELQDRSFGMPSQPSDILEAENWYGALYYKIIPVEKGRRTMYTVLAWDHNSSMSQVKMIDVMYVSGNTIKLGNPIFKIGKETFNRVFFEHSKKATMHMNFEDDRKRIMMDHLSPETPSMKNFKSFYVPDLSYDAFVFEGSKWILHEDVVGVNKDADQKKQFVYVTDEKTGKVERREIKTKWENPEDLDAPAGGTEHVAVTPENLNPEDKEKTDLDKRSKKDKRDPNELSIFKDLKKDKKRKRSN